MKNNSCFQILICDYFIFISSFLYLFIYLYLADSTIYFFIYIFLKEREDSHMSNSDLCPVDYLKVCTAKQFFIVYN